MRICVAVLRSFATFWKIWLISHNHSTRSSRDELGLTVEYKKDLERNKNSLLVLAGTEGELEYCNEFGRGEGSVRSLGFHQVQLLRVTYHHASPFRTIGTETPTQAFLTALSPYC